MYAISERIKEGLFARNMKQADLVKATGIGKSSISTYISGEYEPKQKNIYKIAAALNVSEAWLMGYDVPMGKEIPAPISESELSDLDVQLMDILKSLTIDQKELLLAQIKMMRGNK